jgi:hypothetical protein
MSVNELFFFVMVICAPFVLSGSIVGQPTAA